MLTRIGSTKPSQYSSPDVARLLVGYDSASSHTSAGTAPTGANRTRLIRQTAGAASAATIRRPPLLFN